MRVTSTAAFAAALLLSTLPQLAAGFGEFHMVPSFDGTELKVNTYEPTEAARRSAPAPVVIFVNSWATPVIEYLAQCERLARDGFFAVQYEARGWYSSGGNVGPASPDDVRDHTALLEWVAKTWGDKVDTTNVAAAGISYGSGVSLLAAAHNPNIKAVLALSGWVDLLDALWWNEAPSLVWAQLLLQSVNLVGEPKKDLEQQLDNIYTYTNVNATREWAAIRSPRTFLDVYNERRLPIFMANNYEDNLFHANFQVEFWEKLQGPKKLYLRQGIHVQGEGTGLIPFVENDVWAAGHKWVRRFLRDEPNKIDEAPLVSMQVSAKLDFHILPGENPEFTEVMYSSWPPVLPEEKYEVLRFGLKAGDMGSLVAEGAAGKTSQELTFTKHTVMDLGTPVLTPLLKPLMLHEINLRKLEVESEVMFLSEPFAQKTRVCGNVVVEGLAALSMTHERFQLMGYLWRVEPKPSWWRTLFGHSATLLGHVPLGVWESDIGVSTPLPALGFHTVCADIGAGESIGLGFNLYNVLYKSPTHDKTLRVWLQYEDAVLKVPTTATL